jgi:hypothetical protein
MYKKILTDPYFYFLLFKIRSGKNRVHGVQVMWRGIRRLKDVVLGILLIKGKHPKIPLRISYDSGLIVQQKNCLNVWQAVGLSVII